MGFKEVIAKLRGGNSEKKEMFKQADMQMQVQKILEERQKSANERELERYQKEEREKQIKDALDYMRKKRDEDIKFGHNPLNVKNITAHTQWEVLKEKNQFSGKGNMFANQKSCLQSNPNLLKNNKSLYGI